MNGTEYNHGSAHMGMGAAFIVGNCARYKICKSYNKRASA